MPFAQIDEGVRLYYELTGPEDGPIVLQFGGGLFGGTTSRSSTTASGSRAFAC
jgi:hypothetical protein